MAPKWPCWGRSCWRPRASWCDEKFNEKLALRDIYGFVAFNMCNVIVLDIHDIYGFRVY